MGYYRCPNGHIMIKNTDDNGRGTWMHRALELRDIDACGTTTDRALDTRFGKSGFCSRSRRKGPPYDGLLPSSA